MFKISLRKLDYKNRIVSIVFGLGLALAAIIIWIDIPAAKNIYKIKADIEFQRVDLEKKYAKSQQMKKMALNLGKIEGDIDRLNKIFISEYRELEFITQLEQIALNNALTQDINLNKGEVESKGPYHSSVLYINCQGGYENIIKYLSDLESLDYYINIEDLNLVSGEESGQHNLTLKASTFWR